MPGGKFGTTFGRDGITGTPWQAWIGADNPGLVTDPAVLPNTVQPQRHMIVFPELAFWQWVQTWVSDVSAVRDYVTEADHQRRNASWPGRVRPREVRS